MKQFALPTFACLVAAVFLLLNGCKKDVEPDFLMNQQKIASSEVQPSADDSLKLLKVFVGDSVYFRDVSEPLSAVSSRSWEFSGDSISDVQDQEFTGWVFNDPGFYKVLLCVNGDTNCAGKWVFVRELEGPGVVIDTPIYTPPTPPIDPGEPTQQSSTPPPAAAPLLEFNSPSQASTSKVDKVDVEAVATNVRRKDQLTLTINGKPTSSFSFNPANGKITTKAPLNEGDNNIELTAKNSGGSVTQSIMVKYERKILPGPTKYGSVGIAKGNHKTTNECVALLKESTVSSTLSPSVNLTLQSLFIYTDNCGGVKVSLKGPEGTRGFTTDVNKGRSQISFGDIDAKLNAGSTYTLTLNAFNPYDACTSSAAPRFEEQTCDAVKSANSDQLKLDQKGNLLLFDLKYSYQ